MFKFIKSILKSVHFYIFNHFFRLHFNFKRYERILQKSDIQILLHSWNLLFVVFQKETPTPRVNLYRRPCGVAVTHLRAHLTLTSPSPLPSTLQTLASGAATASRRPACTLPLL